MVSVMKHLLDIIYSSGGIRRDDTVSNTRELTLIIKPKLGRRKKTKDTEPITLIRQLWVQ